MLAPPSAPNQSTEDSSQLPQPNPPPSSLSPLHSITSLGLQACTDTEHFFDDTFWSSIDVAANALDNFKAREYIGNKCLRFTKFATSSTHIMKLAVSHAATSGRFLNPPLKVCNSAAQCTHPYPHLPPQHFLHSRRQCFCHSYVPHITGPYVGGSDDDPAAAVPICTIKEFPYSDQHCLVFAKSEFMFEFTTVPQSAESVLSRHEKPLDSDRLLILERIAGAMVPVSTFDDCIMWACALYDEHVYRTHTIVLEHPEDEVTETGRFWQPPRRFPSTQAFDWADPIARNFVLAAAVLKAKTCGIAPPDYNDQHTAPAKVARVEPCEPTVSYAAERRHKLALQQLDHASRDASADLDHIKRLQSEEQTKYHAFKEAETERTLASLLKLSCPTRTFHSIDFNKDDVSHM